MNNNEIRVKFIAESGQFTKAVSDVKNDLGDASNKAKSLGQNIQASFTRAKASLGDFSRDLMKIGTSIAAVGVIAGGAMFKMAQDGAQFIDSQNDAAVALDGSIDGLRALQLAAGEAAVSQGELQSAMIQLNKRLGDAMAGTGPAVEALKSLNLEAKALSEMDVDTRMAAIADAIKAAGLSSAEAAAILSDLGIKSADIVAMFKQGGDAIRDARQSVIDYGLSVSQLDADKIGAFNDGLDRMGLVWEALSNKLATTVVGALGDDLTRVGEIVQQLSGWIAGLDDNTVLWTVGLVALGAAVGTVIAALGVIAGAITAIGAPIALAVTAVLGLGAAWLVFKDNIVATWNAWEDSWDAMTAKVGEIKQVIADFAASILATFAELPGKMLEVGGQIIQGLADGIAAKWEEVKAGIMDIPNQVSNAFTGFFQIKSPSKLMYSHGSYIMQGLNNGMVDATPGVVGSAQSISQQVDAAFATLGSTAAPQLKSLAETSNDVFSQMGSVIESHFGQAIDGLIDGTFNAQEAIQSLLKDLLKMLANQVFQSLFGGMFGGGGGGGGIGGFLGGLFGSKNGNVFHKNGGVMNTPFKFPMGDGRTGVGAEAGPEAIIPLKRNSRGQLGVTASGGGGGGGSSINNSFAVTINPAPNHSQEDSRKMAADFNKMVEVKVIETMAKQRNAGVGGKANRMF